MKKLLTTIAIAVALAFPTAVSADPDRGGSNLPHMANSDGVAVSYQGRVTCRLKLQDRFVIEEDIQVQETVRIEVRKGPNKGCHGDVLRREIHLTQSWEEAPDFSNIPIMKSFYYEAGHYITKDNVRVMVRHTSEHVCIINSGTLVKVLEYESRGRFIEVRSGPQNDKCPGWVPADAVAELPIVFKTGRWDDYVPVFKTKRDYFNARDRNIFKNMVCRLAKDVVLDEAKPYRDWGLSEIRKGTCSGWTDRGVIR